MNQNLTIEATDCSPRVEFKTNGRLLLKGRSLFLDVNVFYNPLIDWVSQLKADSVKFTIDLEYFNSGSLMKIFELLKIIDASKDVDTFDVIWKFEKDDDATLEKGQIFNAHLKRTKFTFTEYAEDELLQFYDCR